MPKGTRNNKWSIYYRAGPNGQMNSCRDFALFVLVIGLLGAVDSACGASPGRSQNQNQNWVRKTGFEWINGVLAKEVQESIINPGNRIAELETLVLKSDFRADLQWKYLTQGKLVFRPRILVNGSQVHYSDTDVTLQKNKIQPDISEVFADWSLGDSLSVVVGLQSYQWGPAELASPSNPIFHFNSSQKSYLFKDKGRFLGRMNFSIGESFSAVFLQEAFNNQEPYWIADRDFEKKTLLKIEGRSSTQANRYFGVVFGQQEARRFLTGIYFNLNFSESFSVYMDGKFSEGSIAYYPTEVMPGVSMQLPSEAMTNEAQYYVIGGFRWEGRWDIRAEYLYNSAGYKTDEITSAINSTVSNNPYFLFNLNRLTRSGLEFIGQHYAYLSVRIPDLGKKKDGSAALRFLYSLQDESSVTQASFETALGDMLNFYLESSVNAGPDNAEFNLLEKASLFLGVRLSW